MKNKILLLVIFCTITLSLNASKDTLETSLKIINGKEIFQPQSDFWDKYSSGIIAGITILISLGISVWQARVSQRHTRANSIAEARIQWIAELRPLLGHLISDTSEISSIYKNIEKYYDKDKNEFKTDLNAVDNRIFEDLLLKLRDIRNRHEVTFNQIKLFLNKDEKEHKEFIDYVVNYIKSSKKEIFRKDFENNYNSAEVISKGQIILKNAWEQAKNEKNKKSCCKRNLK